MIVSVIIKTLNEERRIGRTIETALAAIASVDGEIIVADSGSSDRTIEIATGYPVRIVQIVPPAEPSCGIGPQLGYQYAKGSYICLIDGDMELDETFLGEALDFLAKNPKVAGVTGHVEEKMLDSLEYTRRVTRNAPEARTGSIDRMNGGGFYRRAAIESVGYFTDRNLHCHEEFELGVRLRSKGWLLHRLDRLFVSHYGHSINSYRLLVRRWRTKYLFGIGELLRASVGQPYWRNVLADLPELKLWALVACWMLASLAVLVMVPAKAIAVSAVLVLAAAVVTAMSIRKRSFTMGLYTVVAWLFHTTAVPFGYLRPRRDPRQWIESRELGGQDAENAPAGLDGDGNRWTGVCQRVG